MLLALLSLTNLGPPTPNLLSTIIIFDHHFAPYKTGGMPFKEFYSRGMHIVLDNTFATMADLVGFDRYINTKVDPPCRHLD
jgi:hypothetical protein